MSKTIKDQITDLENTRAAQIAEQDSIMRKAIDAGRTTDDDEAERVDEIDTTVKRIDADIQRLRRMDARNVEQAKAVSGNSPAEAAASREPRAHNGVAAPSVIRARETDDKFEGQSFVRTVIAKAAARLRGVPAAMVAAERWGRTNPRLVEVVRVGEVPGGGTGSGEWGSELVAIDGKYRGDFIEYLYSQTVYDKLDLRNVPANVTIRGQDGVATGYWFGESKAIPATTVDFMSVNLTPLEVGAICSVSNKLLRLADPDAELWIRDALVNACAQRIDTTFLSNAAAVAGVSPAGILNGVTAITASGTTAAALRADNLSLYAGFLAAKNVSGLKLVMNPATAKAISLMTGDVSDTALFPQLTAMGGTLLGDNVITGDNVPAGTVILLSPKDIYRIGDTGVDVRISDVATIEQSTVPTGATDTPVAMSQAITSMYQEDSSAIRVIRSINFAKRRASAVAVVTGAAYAA